MSRQRKVLKIADETYGQLTSSDWWSPTDDRLLIQCAQRGFSAKRIYQTVKFSVPFSRKEISERWRELLYNEGVTKNVIPMVLKVSRVSQTRIPWRKNEDKIIRKELKEKKFLSFAHILHHHRKEFHCSRTVGSLESHYWSLKKRGKLDDIDIPKHKRGSTRQQIDMDSPPTTPKKKKRRKKKSSKKEDSSIFDFHDFKASGISKKKGKETSKKKKRNTGKRASRKAVKIEEILKLNKPSPDLTKIPPNAFAYLDGMNCRLFIEKMNTHVGKKTVSITPDIDLSLEGNASKCVGRQASIHFVKRPSPQNPNNFECFFEITNKSKKRIFVGDVEVFKGRRERVNSGQVLSFPGAQLKFKFCEIQERMGIAARKFFGGVVPNSLPNFVPNLNGGIPRTVHPHIPFSPLIFPPKIPLPQKKGGGLGTGRITYPFGGPLPPPPPQMPNFVTNVQKNGNGNQIISSNMVVPKPPDE